jgi:hypothetical protein
MRPKEVTLGGSEAKSGTGASKTKYAAFTPDSGLHLSSVPRIAQDCSCSPNEAKRNPGPQSGRLFPQVPNPNNPSRNFNLGDTKKYQ